MSLRELLGDIYGRTHWLRGLLLPHPARAVDIDACYRSKSIDWVHAWKAAEDDEDSCIWGRSLDAIAFIIDRSLSIRHTLRTPRQCAWEQMWEVQVVQPSIE